MVKSVFSIIVILVSTVLVYAAEDEQQFLNPGVEEAYNPRALSVKEVLQQSVFSGNVAPDNLAEGRLTTYDPMLVTITASMKSRLPVRDDSLWRPIHLPPPDPAVNNICPHSFKAFVKNVNTSSPYTFVILPGSYATWKRGSFNNQTIAVLDKHFGNPTIISFAGYLSPEFLEGTCENIPWNTIAIAKDFYSRLRVYLSAIHTTPEYTGIIGFSGGGGLAVSVLGMDAQSVKSDNGKRVFGLGGAVFSPTLHGRTIFENLDTAIEHIDHSRVLTEVSGSLKEVSHVTFLIKALISNGLGLDWRDIVDLYADDPNSFWERSLNEFTHSDLKGTLKAVGFDVDHVRGPFGYYNVYINTGLRNFLSKPSHQVSVEHLDEVYDRLQNIDLYFASIDRPLLIYLSQDDPILSSYEVSGQPQTITEILERAERNPNITVFNPKYGAHTGALLDPIFDSLIHSVFTEEIK